MIMDDLIKRLEEAGEGSRELSDEVLLACGWKKSSWGYFYGPLYSWISPDGKSYTDELHFPDPTQSLDDALTLVPEGWRVYELSETSMGDWRCILVRRSDYFTTDCVHLSTPSLALCIAGLKARNDS